MIYKNRVLNSNLSYIKKKSKIELCIIIIKIIVIAFFSVYFISNMDPYFLGQDSFLYGLGAIGIVEGTFEKTNPFLEETGRYEFIPRQWVITENNSVIPSTSVGLMAIGSIFYSLFGYYGLFYLVPISSIFLLILSERITTKFFGSIAGLTALLLISSNLFFVRTGTDLLTGNISTVFLLIGFFYLINFLKTPKLSFAIIISTVFAISTLIRISNLIFFPVEFILIFAFFIYKSRKKKLFKIKITKNSIIIFSLLLLPWIVFFTFQFSYNDYYFGDPLTKYVDVRIKIDPNISHNLDSSSLLSLDDSKIEKAGILSQYLLPNPLSGARTIEKSYENIFGSNWLGIVPIVFLAGTIIFAFIKKIKRTELFVALAFSGAIILFYSSVVGHIDPDRGVSGRYMIPSFIFSTFVYSFIVQNIVSKNLFSNKTHFILVKSLVIIILLIFFIFALNHVTPVTQWLNSDEKFNNPSILAEQYPLDMEGLKHESIIVNTMGSWVVDYGVTPFHPFYGFSIRGEIDETKFPQEPIQLLKELLKNEHDVYTFKESSHVIENQYFNYLFNHHEMVLKEHSKSFCKITLKENNTEFSDKICLND